MENGTWELTKLPQGRKAVGCKWTFKIKTGANGEITRYKARLVAQGFSQKYGEDYEVFAPVVKQATIRTLLTIAGKEKMVVRHYDVKTAFLNRTEIHDQMKNPDIYRSAIGALLYLSVNTRPDIAVSASILGRKVTNPS